MNDYLTNVDHVKAEELAKRAREMLDSGYRIHYHVWTTESFLETLIQCKSQVAFPFEIEACVHNGLECIAVLRCTR